ncbi:MAG: ribosome-associated translation inhibitor RaiA [bacterium]
MRLVKLQAEQMELTPAIRAYVEERLLKGLAKLTLNFDDRGTRLSVEVGKTSTHHKKGDYFRAEAHLMIPGHNLRAEAILDDLYASIDAVRDDLKRQLSQLESKLRTKQRKGAVKAKRVLKDKGAIAEVSEE